MYLDNNLINQPTAALRLVSKEVIRLSGIVKEIITGIAEVSSLKDREYKEKLQQKIQTVQSLDDRITEYLTNLFSAGVLTEEQATQTAGIMYVLSDVNRI